MNLSDLLIDCFTNKNFYILFISEKKIFEKILNVLKNLNNSNNNKENNNKENKNEISKCLFKIMNNLNENILKDFGANIVTPLKNKDENEANLFSFNSINMGLDDEFNEDIDEKKISPEEIKLKLDQNFVILSEISIEIIKDFIESDKDFLKDTKVFNTTFNQEKRLLGTKR